jgi:hypothetical protein
MKLTKTLLAAALSAGLFSATSAHAALSANLDDHGFTVFDSDLNIYWLANANLAATETFGVRGINANGTMNWETAVSWIRAMNSARYLGYNDWRLPTVIDTGTPGCNFAYSGTDCGYNVNTATGEMAHLWYDELGNKAYYDTAGAWPQPGWGLTNTGPFTSIQFAGAYWSGTEYAPDTNSAWSFNTGGGQGRNTKGFDAFAWAVRPAAPVPEPETYVMLLAGLGLLGFTARRRTNLV